MTESPLGLIGDTHDGKFSPRFFGPFLTLASQLQQRLGWGEGSGGRFYIIKGTLPDWKRGIKPNQPWS